MRRRQRSCFCALARSALHRLASRPDGTGTRTDMPRPRWLRFLILPAPDTVRCDPNPRVPIRRARETYAPHSGAPVAHKSMLNSATRSFAHVGPCTRRRAAARPRARSQAARDRARAARSPASACKYTAADAASNASMSGCASSAPITPERTSPVPATAIAGVPRAHTRMRPPGSATIVRAPLSTTTQPLRSARRCAAS